MTADQWYIEIVKVLDPTDPKGTRAAIAEIVGRIQLAESERAAGVCHTQRNNTTFMWRSACESCCDAILATSPGKGGG